MPAAAQQITDLDAIIGPPKKVKVNDETFTLPADCPAELYLKLTAYISAEDLDEHEAAEDLYDDILGLMQVHQPDMETLPFGLVGMIHIIPAVYGGTEDAAPDRPSRGTRSTSRPKGRKKPNRSRGSKS
jgi:hypothetical protein